MRRDEDEPKTRCESGLGNGLNGTRLGRPDWARVVPLVVPRVRSGKSFYVLYEIYNLGQDSTGSQFVPGALDITDHQLIEDARRMPRNCLLGDIVKV